MTYTPCRAIAATVILTLLACCFGTGCGATSGNGAGSAGDAASPRRSLTLWSRTTTQKYTYFQLKADGQLLYAGGRDAMWRDAKPVVKLTRPQQEQVWSVVEKHKLVDAPNTLFPSAKTVQYELSLNTGGFLGTTINCVDDMVPGMKELHDLLFKLQGDVRYDHPALQR